MTKNAPDTVTADDPLRAISARLGLWYGQWKQGEKDKDSARQELFKEIDKQVSTDERLVEIHAASEEEAREQIAKRFPAWVLDDIRPIAPGAEDFEAIITENPSFKRYTYFNPDTKMVYERQVVSGTPILDDEKLLAENPDLYARVTELPYEDWITNLMYHCGVESQDVDERLTEYLQILPNGPQRTLKDLETLPDEDIAALQNYVYEGKPSARLAPPRKATAEELSELE